jgi:phytoene desaturase
MKSVLIIGAGIGGIATAARLAQHGYQVTVLEKNEWAGGRCDRLIKDGHLLDTGTTLFLLPALYTRTFSELGARLEDHLELQRIDPSYRLFFRDGARLDLTSDLQNMQCQLEALEPGSFGAYLRYLNEGHLHYKLSLKYLMGRNFRNLVEYCCLKNLYLLFKLKALKKHYHHIGKYFHDPRLKAAFTFQNMYMGLSPYNAPALYSLLQYTEFAHGVWYPKGGMYRVIEVLTAIAEKKGVQFLYNTAVDAVNVNSQTATGVTLADGRRLPADIVVANADLPYVYRHLLPDERIAARLERKKFSCSALMFYWGIDRQYLQLGPHNLFLGGDNQQSFDPIFSRFTLPPDPSFYIHVPTRVEPAMAPPGHDTLTVAIPVGHLNERTPQDWDALQIRARHIVMNRLAEIGVHHLTAHLKFELCFTPRDWQGRYNLANGATHGLAHTALQMGYFRPHNRHHRYRNLYFVGASTHPGTGLPTVLESARLTTERILEDLQLNHLPQKTTSAAPAPNTA